MNRADIEKLLADYADGELDADARKEVEAHLPTDPDARAAVERWRALRESARRALLSEAVPPRLRDRVRAGLRVTPTVERSRVYRLSLPWLAVAALVVLAIFISPEKLTPTAVEATGFSGVYRRCALEYRHDSFGVREGASWEEFIGSSREGSVEKVERHAHFSCRLPDIGECANYRLVGACECPPSDDVKAVHAYFKCGDAPGNIVSVFAVDRCICMCEHGQACPHAGKGERTYCTASDDPVTLVSWNEGNRGYVMCCGVLTSEQLMHLADGLTLAHLREIELAARDFIASMPHP